MGNAEPGPSTSKRPALRALFAFEGGLTKVSADFSGAIAGGSPQRPSLPSYVAGQLGREGVTRRSNNGASYFDGVHFGVMNL